MKIISKILFVFICILFLLQFSTFKLYPWFKHYGGAQDDNGYSIQQTSDGGYIAAGTTESYTYGLTDFAIYKLDSNGDKIWFKHYGGTGNDVALSIQQTSDGGYVTAGYTESYTFGLSDFAIYKLNSNGNKIWFKHYGGTNYDSAYSTQQTSDGGYIVTGRTKSYTHGNYDFAIYKLDSSGNKVWFRHYGGTDWDEARSIKQTSDGDYIVAGTSKSYTHGDWDYAIYKLNSSGSKLWFRHYGGTDSDVTQSIQNTSDGGYIVTGHTYSYTYGQNDFAIYKLDSSGNKVWFKHYGGTNYDWGDSIQQTSDGGYIVAGYTWSYTYGQGDCGIYKLNSIGNKVWFRHYGGSQDDDGHSIQQTSDGGYVVAGKTESYTYGGEDFAIYKLDSNGDK